MELKKYNEIVKKNTPKEDRLLNAVKAFFIGGLIGVFSELLVNIYINLFELTRIDATTYMIITLIFLGCLLTGLGIYDKLVRKFNAGVIIPITGFAHSVMSATMEYKKEGFVTGIGTNMFKLAGTVIVYGVISAYVCGLIRILIGG